MLIFFLLIIFPTLLLTVRTFKNLDRLNKMLTDVARWTVFIGIPIVFIYAVFHMVTNWHEYTLEDHLTKLASVLVAGIFIELARRFIRKVEDAKDRGGEGS